MTKHNEKAILAAEAISAPVEAVVAAPAATVSPEMIAAIQAVVMASMAQFKDSMADMVKQFAPPAPKVQGVGDYQQAGYKSMLKGIETEPDQDLRHVGPAKISSWFNSLEGRWKKLYNSRSVDGNAVSMNWTKG